MSGDFFDVQTSFGTITVDLLLRPHVRIELPPGPDRQGVGVTTVIELHPEEAFALAEALRAASTRVLIVTGEATEPAERGSSPEG